MLSIVISLPPTSDILETLCIKTCKRYSLRFKIKVTFGHELRYEIKVTFGDIALKLHQTN
jgi:hypothetical protein